MGLVTMKESLQGVEKKKKKKGVIRTGTGTGIGIVLVKRIGIGRKAGTRTGRKAGTWTGRKAGTGTGIGKRTEKKIAIIEIAIGNVVGNTVRGGEIGMTMITTEAETMIGN